MLQFIIAMYSVRLFIRFTTVPLQFQNTVHFTALAAGSTSTNIKHR